MDTEVPGSAEFVVSRLTIRGRLCPHNPKLASSTSSGVPSCLGFFYRKSNLILLLKTSCLCKTCYNTAVPNGYNAYCTPSEQFASRDPPGMDSGVQWWQFRPVGLEIYGLSDLIRLPLSTSSDDHQALELFAKQYRPFYMTLFHTLGKYVPKGLIDRDVNIASSQKNVPGEPGLGTTRQDKPATSEPADWYSTRPTTVGGSKPSSNPNLSSNTNRPPNLVSLASGVRSNQQVQSSSSVPAYVGRSSEQNDVRLASEMAAKPPQSFYIVNQRPLPDRTQLTAMKPKVSSTNIPGRFPTPASLKSPSQAAPTNERKDLQAPNHFSGNPASSSGAGPMSRFPPYTPLPQMELLSAEPNLNSKTSGSGVEISLLKRGSGSINQPKQSRAAATTQGAQISSQMPNLASKGSGMIRVPTFNPQKTPRNDGLFSMNDFRPSISTTSSNTLKQPTNRERLIPQNARLQAQVPFRGSQRDMLARSSMLRTAPDLARISGMGSRLDTRPNVVPSSLGRTFRGVPHSRFDGTQGSTRSFPHPKPHYEPGHGHKDRSNNESQERDEETRELKDELRSLEEDIELKEDVAKLNKDIDELDEALELRSEQGHAAEDLVDFPGDLPGRLEEPLISFDTPDHPLVENSDNLSRDNPDEFSTDSFKMRPFDENDESSIDKSESLQDPKDSLKSTVNTTTTDNRSRRLDEDSPDINDEARRHEGDNTSRDVADLAMGVLGGALLGDFLNEEKELEDPLLRDSTDKQDLFNDRILDHGEDPLQEQSGAEQDDDDPLPPRDLSQDGLYDIGDGLEVNGNGGTNLVHPNDEEEEESQATIFPQHCEDDDALTGNSGIFSSDEPAFSGFGEDENGDLGETERGWEFDQHEHENAALSSEMDHLFEERDSETVFDDQNIVFPEPDLGTEDRDLNEGNEFHNIFRDTAGQNEYENEARECEGLGDTFDEDEGQEGHEKDFGIFDGHDGLADDQLDPDNAFNKNDEDQDQAQMDAFMDPDTDLQLEDEIDHSQNPIEDEAAFGFGLDQIDAEDENLDDLIEPDDENNSVDLENPFAIDNEDDLEGDSPRFQSDDGELGDKDNNLECLDEIGDGNTFLDLDDGFERDKEGETFDFDPETEDPLAGHECDDGIFDNELKPESYDDPTANHDFDGDMEERGYESDPTIGDPLSDKFEDRTDNDDLTYNKDIYGAMEENDLGLEPNNDFSNDFENPLGNDELYEENSLDTNDDFDGLLPSDNLQNDVGDASAETYNDFDGAGMDFYDGGQLEDYGGDAEFAGTGVDYDEGENAGYGGGYVEGEVYE
ncbi:uncharacterized protein LY89DRAFT_717380 [Mollisia scopiformis]|uniref:Uncharacterized protein n=1 Tax=Mollisia scopiformis TaxID=149040 RepID=A0A194XF89_MOLSC|nr:uncharacterized protein LY89DRAFT_717380 [Mollisia scopiformis]KUJ18860.1 hypothetical protein LY89DRAFT_717380 [Mollisia scopiformis]